MKATFEFYTNGKFKLGIWIKDGGTPQTGQYFESVMDLFYEDKFSPSDVILTFKKVSALIQIQSFPSDLLAVFPNQLNSVGDPEFPLDLFWFKKMSEKKMIQRGIFTLTKYQFRFNKNDFKLIVEYGGQKREWTLDRNSRLTTFRQVFNSVSEWIWSIDRELADCDCLN